jgi:hypothetical protein
LFDFKPIGWRMVMRSVKTVGICLTAAAIMIGAMGVTGCSNNAANKVKTNSLDGRNNIAPYSTYNRGTVNPLGTGTNASRIGTNNAMEWSQKAADQIVKIPGVKSARVILMNRDAYVAVTLDNKVTPKSTAVPHHRGGVTPRSLSGNMTGIDGVRGTTGTTGTYGIRGTTGTPGAPGAPGTYGTRGITGMPGIPGTTGTYGIRGTTGTPGAPGAPGAPGTYGTRGTDGGMHGMNYGTNYRSNNTSTYGTNYGSMSGLDGRHPSTVRPYNATNPLANPTRGTSPTTRSASHDVTVTDALKLKIAHAVKHSVPQVNNVYVSANPDFVSRINGYANQFRNGNPITGIGEEFTALINRIFPARTGTTVTPNSYNPSTYRNPSNMNVPMKPSTYR